MGVVQWSVEWDSRLCGSVCQPAGKGNMLFHQAIMLALPPACMLAISAGFHESIVMERTKVRWVPRLRCFPLHSRQKRMPVTRA